MPDCIQSPPTQCFPLTYITKMKEKMTLAAWYGSIELLSSHMNIALVTLHWKNDFVQGLGLKNCLCPRVQVKDRLWRTWPKCSKTLSRHSWCLLRLVKSIGRTRTSLAERPWLLPASMHLSLISSSRSLDLAEMTNLAPCFAASMAQAAPIPVDAPVTQTTWPFSSSKIWQELNSINSSVHSVYKK